MAMLSFAAASVTATSAPAAGTGSSMVALTVESVTSLDATACNPGISDVTDFGSVPGASIVRTGTDCLVEFGSTNDTSMLRVFQRDGGGDAMRAGPASGSGVLGMWTFDRGLTDLADQSSTANAGTLPGGTMDPTVLAGPSGFGDALDFDGANDRVTIPYHASYDISSLTVDAWFRAPATETSGYVVMRGNTDCSTGGLCSWALWLDTAGRLEIDVERSNVEYQLTTPTDITDNTWHHVAMTIDGSNRIRAYVDGIERGTSLLLPGPIDLGVAPVVVGNSPMNSTGSRLDATIDEVRITAGAAAPATILRWATGRVRDYADGSNDFDTPGATFFGGCLESVSGGATGGAGAWNPNAGCTAGDGNWWNPIPANSGAAGAIVARAPVADDDAVAHLRFGLRTASSTPLGAYEAPVWFEVVAPAT